VLFNSIDFVIFFSAVFLLYWFFTNQSFRLQNLLIVITSYIFYGWWDARFLLLIIFSSVVDYSIGIAMTDPRFQVKKKLILWISLIVNLGLLGYFKYCDFFIESFIQAFSYCGIEFRPDSLNIILPVGISFYTFQSLSYTIDVYQKKLEPTKNIISFMAFVSFFPQLVAGPIERATVLLPQFEKKRTFDYDKAVDGLRQILWGLVKKTVIADNCAEYADLMFNQPEDYSGSTLVLGAIFFSFQIYGDFSGYSDIAVGTSRLLGFQLSQNFNFPYFSRNIAEFWRRWHISLSTWFRDYVYIPLGGSYCSPVRQIRNIFLVFTLSGFWHGAEWKYLVWGGLNALLFLPFIGSADNMKNHRFIAKLNIPSKLNEVISILFTFAIVTAAFIIFRAKDLSYSCIYFSRIFSSSIFHIPEFENMTRGILTITILLIFIIIEWYGKENQYAIEGLKNKARIWRWISYYLIIVIIFLMAGRHQQFLYFQF
jgi:alginate O-acetyltransferase complex protein AlgI